VTDIGLKGLSGIDLIERLAADRPGLPLIALSMHEDIEHLAAAFRAGARGYVAKSSDASELRSALAAVCAGDTFLDQTMLSLVLAPLVGAPRPRADAGVGDLDALTDREREVFLHLAKNATIDEIGAELGISPKTVENHRGAIYAKLGLSDRLSLYHYARRLGLAD
jgi:DNA-binding NarL/FixJ family response regulator